MAVQGEVCRLFGLVCIVLVLAVCLVETEACMLCGLQACCPGSATDHPPGWQAGWVDMYCTDS
jgi:hypothetical protein